MNRLEFMEQLAKKLSKLPAEEAKEALDYYAQYFDDAGEENEQTVIAELNSPSNIASQIIAQFAVKGPADEKRKKSGFSVVMVVLLAVFASPIALPLGMMVVVLAVALIIVLVSLVLAIGAAGFGAFVAGLASAVVSVPLMFQSVTVGLFNLGTGLAAAGTGFAILLGAFMLGRVGFKALARSVGKFILKRSGK